MCITPILKSLVVPIIWMTLVGAIYSRIAPFSALNRIFSPANEEATLKTKQPIKFQGLFKVTNQIAGKWKTKSIMWQILQLLFPKLLLFPHPKMDEFNFRPAQYCINKIFELTKSCIWAISKWMNLVSCNFGLKSYLWFQPKLHPTQFSYHYQLIPLVARLIKVTQNGL